MKGKLAIIQRRTNAVREANLMLPFFSHEISEFGSIHFNFYVKLKKMREITDISQVSWKGKPPLLFLTIEDWFNLPQ